MDDTSQHPPERTGPSKTFLIRGAVAIGIVAIILVVHSGVLQKIFTKSGAGSPNGPLVADKTLGEVVGADSNQNGIADWEERLWGLDPSVTFTDGVSNKQIIEEKKKALGGNGDTGPVTETDRVARGLFSSVSALGQSSDVTDSALSAVGEKFADAIHFEQARTYYTVNDITDTKTTLRSLQVYYTSISALAGMYDNLADMDTVISGLESQDFSQVRTLGDDAVKYRAYARAIVQTPVPIGIAQYHLILANSIAGIADAFDKIAKFEDDGIVGAQGVSLYQQHYVKLQRALFDMQQYFARYGILNS